MPPAALGRGRAAGGVALKRKKKSGAWPRTNYTEMARREFGRLRVVRDTGRRQGGHVVWLCSCSCGGSTETTGSNLRTGNTTSCGCAQREIAHKSNDQRKKR